ncbi:MULTISPECIES: ABC transporter permease [unclassified Meiothermus]|uniref:ABC transporter permease n=1 Tax=unclassified Meiothermus TaxID=370471 RepID=UPI000D7CC4F9|nr:MULTISPECIES: ABC transporter permease [unclassified Meiothermus]PZA07871.1 ABC transporter permease [Meiothermus sp. Pnk-1]RYM38824.1 ABC transporter permease [Meiothermus sp. PNK-Is4]
MNRLLVWYGELGTAGSILRRGLMFLLPALLWLLVFLILPGLALVAVAFAERGSFGEILWNFSLENLSRLLGYGIFGWSPDNLIILARTVWVAFITTLISVLLAYPLAFFIASRKLHQRYVWLALVIIPFWTNLVIRTYAWQLLFAPQLPFAQIAAALHLIEPGTALNPSSFAVYVGMVSAFLPFVVLPLYSSVERLDWSLVEAAQDLYGSRSRVFFQAILPQTLPGLTVGVILTFIPAMGMFVVPDLLGGAKYLLVGNLIQQQFFSSRDWPFGAALSLGLVLLTLIALQIYRRSGKEVDLV